MARRTGVVGLVLATVLAFVPAAGSVAVAAPTCSGPPVLLVHDFAATAATMRPLANRLAAAGHCTQTLGYGAYPGLIGLGGLRSLVDSAAQLEALIRAAGSTGPVDVVAHGAGSLAVVRALQLARAAGTPLPVRTLIALGGLWAGTNVAFLGDLDLASRRAGTYPTVLAVERLLLDRLCAVCREVIAHSDFLTALTAAGVVVPGVRQVNIVTRYDELVVPYRSGLAPGMENVVLQTRRPGFVEHLGLPSAPGTADLVDSFLGR